MELYLLRHGIAEDAGPGTPDAARRLTPDGEEKLAAVAKRAARAGVAPSLILSSPYVRARDTARIAAKTLGSACPVLYTEALVPHGTPEGVWSVLRDHADEAAILLAGHEPLLSQLGAWLLGCPELRIEMKKATLLRIDIESARRPGPPRGTLRWMMTPALAL